MVLIIVGSVIGHTLICNPAINLLVYFTNWALLATFFTALFGTIIAFNPTYNNRTAKGLAMCHHLMYTIMLFIGPCVVSVYWMVVHQEHLQEIYTKHYHNQWLYHFKIRHTYIVHTVPFMCSLVLMKINKTILLPSHSQALAVLGTLYSISNYYSVLKRGEPVYWFLPWTDYTSALICAGIVGLFTALFLATALFDKWITGEIRHSKEKKIE